MFKLISKKTSSLSTKQIKSICLLKETCWRNKLKSQILWFKKNIRPSDVHNMLLINDKLVGYTCLRKKKMNYPVNKKYFLFDTLIIRKEFRKKYFRKKFFSFYMMQFNSNIIKKNKSIAYLICKKNLAKFYKKYKWLKINKKKGIKKNRIAMIFNYKKKDIKIFLDFIPKLN